MVSKFEILLDTSKKPMINSHSLYPQSYERKADSMYMVLYNHNTRARVSEIFNVAESASAECAC